MTAEVWISARGRIPEAARIALKEALEEDNKKDTPSFGKEDLEVIHRSGTEAGLLGIYNFPGSVYATDGSNGGSWERASSNSTNTGATAANWAAVRKVIPLTGLNQERHA